VEPEQNTAPLVIINLSPENAAVDYMAELRVQGHPKATKMLRSMGYILKK
jgi:hypothetical protein